MNSQNPYEISFRHEILNEFIASVDGFITRNILYSNAEMPDDIRSLEIELWDIYRKLPFENDLNSLNGIEKRLLEMRDNIGEHAPLHKQATDFTEYSESDFKRALEKCCKTLTENKFPADKPQAFLLGGQSGAGKTTIQDIIQRQNPNIIVLDGDRFRAYHPNFDEIQEKHGEASANYTQKFSNSIVNALMKKFRDKRFNLIIEGTCRTAEVPLNTCRVLKEKGYSVNLAVMCTDKKTALQSTINRYNKMKSLGITPRAVPRDKFEETVKAIPENISLLYRSGEFDNILLFNRQNECLYELKKQPQLNPADIVKRELNGNHD